MHDVRRILESYGFSVELIREERLGYIVYEDAVQVVAEPFSDTRTGTWAMKRPTNALKLTRSAKPLASAALAA